MFKRRDIIERFTYHPPRGDQVGRYNAIRDHAREFALRLVEFVDNESDELARALDKLDEAVFLANAAIARHGSLRSIE